MCNALRNKLAMTQHKFAVLIALFFNSPNANQLEVIRDQMMATMMQVWELTLALLQAGCR